MPSFLLTFHSAFLVSLRTTDNHTQTPLRTYTQSLQKNTPEFYDDDVPLLLLGSVTPSALLEEDGGEALSEIYGLMQACGSQSVEHDGLKRSARHSMMLLKYLVCDYVEMEQGQRINNTSVEEGGPVRFSMSPTFFLMRVLHVVQNHGTTTCLRL